MFRWRSFANECKTNSKRQTSKGVHWLLQFSFLVGELSISGSILQTIFGGVLREDFQSLE
jgi:hypothetical protein